MLILLSVQFSLSLFHDNFCRQRKTFWRSKLNTFFVFGRSLGSYCPDVGKQIHCSVEAEAFPYENGTKIFN